MNLSPKIKPESSVTKTSVAKTSSALETYRSDFLIISCLCILAAVLVYLRFQSLDSAIHQDFTEDVWFGSDIERVIRNISDRSQSFRAGVHPLFPLLIYPLVKGAQKLLGTDPISAIQVVISGATALWIGLIAITLRLIGCHRIDTVLYSLLLLFSAGVMFWTAVPESYLFGSLSMTVPLFIIALARRAWVPRYWYVLAGAFSLSITTTNWMAGIFANFVSYRWKRALSLTTNGLLLVSCLWMLQKQLFPRAQFFFASDVLQEELKYVSPQASGGPLRVLFGLFLHPVVMPDIATIPSNRGLADWPLITVQMSAPGSGGVLSTVAVAIWTVLLLAGMWMLFSQQLSKRLDSKLRLFLILTLAGQLALHLVYGDETFLYALHVLPFLITTVALNSLTRLRIVSLCLTSVLIILVAANNSVQFNNASSFLKNTGPLRQQAEHIESPLALADAASR